MLQQKTIEYEGIYYVHILQGNDNGFFKPWGLSHKKDSVFNTDDVLDFRSSYSYQRTWFQKMPFWRSGNQFDANSRECIHTYMQSTCPPNLVQFYIAPSKSIGCGAHLSIMPSSCLIFS